MVCLAAKLFLNNRFSDTVFVTLLRIAVEVAISEAHKLLGTDGVPITSITLLFWRSLRSLRVGSRGRAIHLIAAYLNAEVILVVTV